MNKGIKILICILSVAVGVMACVIYNVENKPKLEEKYNKIESKTSKVEIKSEIPTKTEQPFEFKIKKGFVIPK